MHEKVIRRMVVRQLKKNFPDWQSLVRKQKKALAKQVLEEVVNMYSSDKDITTPLNELLGIPAIQEAEIMSLADMEHFVAEHHKRVLLFPAPYRKKHINDRELRAIDELLNDSIIDRLLAPKGFTPSKRVIFPSHMFRAELLKSLSFSEISYRKYCSKQLDKLEQKTNRAFIGLPLHKKTSISHSRLSQFRTGLTFSQTVNIMVYVIHLFLKSGKLGTNHAIYGIDSSELPVICNTRPLASVKVGDKKVKIYANLDVDCGKRRSKRDKSEYFVGFRIHTLTAINPKTGHSYPLMSLIAPGNHHDNLFLPYLISLGKAIGLDLKIVTADEGYTDAEQNELIRKQHGVTVVTPPDQKVKIPEHVDNETQSVYINKWCEVPMAYLGKTDEGEHEFKCDANTGGCIHSVNCHKYRNIPVDAGIFGQIPEQVEGVDDVKDLRNNLERAFNLLKHREGLEPLRVKSQHGTMTVATFANIANLLLEIVATRKTETKEVCQQKLKAA
ncbi:MAG: transposase [Planctomycetota bacterium]|jgi:hypothetical protein